MRSPKKLMDKRDFEILNKINNGKFYELKPGKQFDPTIVKLSRIGYIKISKVLCGPLALHDGTYGITITKKGKYYLENL